MLIIRVPGLVSLKTNTLASTLSSFRLYLLLLKKDLLNRSDNTMWPHLELVGGLHLLLGGLDVGDGVCELDSLKLFRLVPRRHPSLRVVVIPGLVGGVPLRYPLPNLIFILYFHFIYHMRYMLHL